MKKPKRFWSKVVIGEPKECWEWQASGTRKGYGLFWIHYRNWPAHRVAWFLTYGRIPRGLNVCHHCDNPSCCNPYHLYLGTQADNMADSVRKGRSGRAKLTKEEVLEIRKLHATGEWAKHRLANKYNVSERTIRDILRRRTWKSL